MLGKSVAQQSNMPHRPQLAGALLATVLLVRVLAAPQLVAQGAPAAATFSAAVCPVVYQLDDSPSRRGYHYIFYGNAFFINRDGYLLTAAHVLSEFRNGGQPSILLRRPYAPPRLLKVTVVAIDVIHDVAILRATPNPFDAGYSVAALPLAAAQPATGDRLAVQALRPAHPRDPETFEIPIPESYTATTLTYRVINLDPATLNSHAPSAPLGPTLAAQSAASSATSANSTLLTNIFLFSHEVIRGQSGAPVIDASTHQVVGLIEGRWLHPAAEARQAAATTPASQKSAAPLTAPSLTQGAAVPIPYAKSLLEKNHIRWDAGQ